jgi:hypothetical protein
MDKLLMAVGTIVVVSIVAFGFSFLLAYPTMWMVNYLFTPATLLSLFGFAQLTFWKAFWLNFLCSQLFKGSSSSSSSKK